MARTRQTTQSEDGGAVDAKVEEQREESRERFIDETGRAPTPAEEPVVQEESAAGDADPDDLDARTPGDDVDLGGDDGGIGTELDADAPPAGDEIQPDDGDGGFRAESGRDPSPERDAIDLGGDDGSAGTVLQEDPGLGDGRPQASIDETDRTSALAEQRDAEAFAPETPWSDATDDAPPEKGGPIQTADASASAPEPTAEIPADPDDVFAGEAMPETGVGHEAPTEGTQAGGLDPRAGDVNTEYDTVPDLPGTDPGEFTEEFDEAMQGGNVGGLDGRNDASDYGGGGPTDPNAERPTGGLDGANRSDLHDFNVERATDIVNDPDLSEQEKLDKLDALADTITQAQDAAAEGRDTPDTPGGEPGAPPGTDLPTPGSEEDTGPDEVVGVGSATPVGLNEDGELVQTDGQKELAKEYEGTRYEGLSKLFTGTGTNSTRGQALDDTMRAIDAEGAPPPKPTENEDRLQEGELPSHIRDPSAGWGDEDRANDWFDGTGGGHTDPTDEPGTNVNAGSIGDFDPDVYTGDPGEPVVSQPEITGHELDDYDPNAPVYDEFDG